MYEPNPYEGMLTTLDLMGINTHDTRMHIIHIVEILRKLDIL